MLELTEHLATIVPTALQGSVARTVGMTVAVAGFGAPVGAVAEIRLDSGKLLGAEVIGFQDDLTLLYPYQDTQGVRRGNRVRLVRSRNWLRVGPELLGRVIDARGKCIDAMPQPAMTQRILLEKPASNPIDRPRIETPLSTGIRAIDGLLTCGKGQRMGIFSGSGVGKSVTLGMMARHTTADVNVIALVGERGREVNEFLQRDLGPEGLAKSVVVVATSDQPALLRTRAAFTATAIAEYFRDQQQDVLLMMDSLTRFALAQREIGLAAGEPPTTRGFPPSVFALLPKLVERAGRGPTGSITAFYSVLVEGDDPNEPIADCARSLLDGHTWLSRQLANRGHYPAVDVLDSISRLINDITTAEQRAAINGIRKLLAAYRENEDLISIGAYRNGSNPTVDVAISMLEEINAFLRQTVDESCTVESAQQMLIELYTRSTQAKHPLGANPSAAEAGPSRTTGGKR